MNSQLSGFDAFKADEELKARTRERILAGEGGAVPFKKPLYRRKAFVLSMAASLALVVGAAIIISNYFAAFNQLSAGTPKAINNFMAQAASDGGAVETAETAGEYSEAPAAPGSPDVVYEYDAPEAAPGDAGGAKNKAAEAAPDSAAGATAAATAPAGGKAYTTMVSPAASAGLLTAKYFNDNENFSFWANLIGPNGAFNPFVGRWRLNTANRIVVNVKNGQGTVCGAKVVLTDAQGRDLWSAVSDNKGHAYLFYNVSQIGENPMRVSASMGNLSVIRLYDSKAVPVEISLDLAANSFPKSLDLMFVCDTTGSMGDELSYLQTEMEDIVRRTQTEQGNYPLRLSVNFYRDVGDDYVVRPFPFTTDIGAALSQLKQQSASGGGDFEESVEKALRSAIYDHQWSDTAYAKLLFLVLDAPPHDYAAEEIRSLTREAARLGIRVIPVTGSGIDQNTEFLMRSIDVATGGTYVTLTDDSGIGGSHLEPTIGTSDVYKLNDLIVKIIGDYMK